MRLDWFWSNMVGGVRLRVRENDAESALEVLGEDIPERFSAEEVGEEYEQPACPKCGSRDVGFESLYRGIALVVLWLCAIPLTFPKCRWHCEDCGNEWKGEYV